MSLLANECSCKDRVYVKNEGLDKMDTFKIYVCISQTGVLSNTQAVCEYPVVKTDAVCLGNKRVTLDV